MDIQAYIQSGIIESYVLGLATPEEVAEVDALRNQHIEVEEAINDFSKLLEQQAFDNAVIPPANIRAKVFEAIEDKKEDAAYPFAQLKDEEIVSAPVRRLRTWRFVAAASILLFAVSAAFNFYMYNRYKESSNAYQALLIERNSLQANNQVYQTRLHEWATAAEMMADPKMVMIKMPGIKGKENNMATVFWDTKNKDVYVMSNKLPKVTAGKQYQLWAMVKGKPVDAGTLDPECTSVCKMKNMPQAEAFAITLENAGGSPTPNMQAMYVFGKV